MIPTLRRRDWPYVAAWALVVALVFALQAPNLGFYGPNHGWTSSHGLAIMSHATPENRFVGHALQFQATDGSYGYTYFDRYPPFFSAGMGALLRLAGPLPTGVLAARAAMNVIFVATLAVAAALAHTLLRDRWRALAVTLLAFSGYELVFYKDMIHYDQPALFGNFLVLLAIARYRLAATPRRLEVYTAALVAVALGRGYSSLVIVGLWALWEVVEALGTPGGPLARVRAALRRDAVWVLVVAVVWAAGWIGYNLLAEAARRDVPLAQTSIVDSALRRLPVGGEKAQGRTIGREVPPWGTFATLQLWRLVRWGVPLDWDGLPRPAWPLGLAPVALAGVGVWRLPGRRRGVAVLTAAWGAVWIAAMINLTHGHEYTMMYATGTLLAGWLGVAALLPRRAWVTGALVVGALGACAYANAAVRAEVGNQRAAYTYDYQRINTQITGTGRAVHVNISDGQCVIEDNFCYVLGFYLRDHYLSNFAVADYVLGRLPTYQAHPPGLPPNDTAGLTLLRDTLTPHNTTAHLFDMARAERRTLPADAATIVTFGEALTLQSWTIPDSLTVPACARVHLESWWRPTAPLPANYSLLLALVDANGETVADSNYDLTHVATAAWEPGYTYLDARYVDVPCATPPGAYPLVISVYAPGAPRSLDVVANDGAVLGNFWYLTTVFVE